MLKAQQIYAPDAPVLWNNGDIALGRRLFRTLPEDVYDWGPVFGGGGRWTLIADARLDNRNELCEVLGISSEDAAMMCDSAVLMKAIERWEDEAAARLIGDFAFAAWDRDGERLVLARDFLGARPLHYHLGNGFFAFASMPKGLHGLSEVLTGPDEQTITDFLALMPEDSSTSFFKDIARVQPGHVAVVSRAGVSSRPHWRPKTSTLRLKHSDEYAEVLRASFDEAVASRLRGADGRVATHLSGGLDSGAVTATAAGLLKSNGRVDAFTAVPREGYSVNDQRGRFADEGSHAAAVAALHPNIDHTLIRSGARSPLANLDRNFFLYERPVLNLCNAVWGDAILDEAKRRGHRILLTGQMGNMSFSYAGLEHLGDLLGRGSLLRLLREAVLLRRKGTRLESVVAHAIGPYLSAAFWQKINHWRGRRVGLADYSAINPDHAGAIKERAAARNLDLVYRPRADPRASRLWMLGRTDFGNVNKGRLAGWGIDTRDPTSDRRLVELCLSIPVEQYLKNGETRALARRAFADRLPKMVVRESRKGLQAVDWHEGLDGAREHVRTEVERITALPAAADALDMAKMIRLVDTWPADNWNSHETEARYRLGLLRGLAGGHFLRKASGAN